MLYLLFFVIVLLPNHVFGETAGYTIKSYNVEINVNTDNSFDIIETITANFSEEKHGIIRKIPTSNSIVRNDGSKARNTAFVRDIKVSAPYTKSSSSGYTSLKIGSASQNLLGDHTYTIKYKYYIFGRDGLKNADELYYNIIGTEWDTSIEKVTFKITMPKEFDSSLLGFSSGYKGSKDSSSFTVSSNCTVLYVYTDGTNINSAGSISITNIDKTAPTSTSATITNVTSSGYDVYIYGVSDNASGINRVQFPTWTNSNDQDDIQSNWWSNSSATGTRQSNGTTWYYRVNITDHKNESGVYNTHIYGYDNAGNQICLATLQTTVPAPPPLPTTTNYTGCYADVNDDGTVDGVIFIDLAKGALGYWNPGNNSWAASNNTGVYSYSAVTSGLRSYKISTKTSSYSGKFGTKSVIVPNGTSGSPRFYVMALSDFDTSTHNWWADALKSKTQTVGSVTFRLPSKMEWATFGGQLGITTSNYSSSYGLSRWYWSSTENGSSYAWYADFNNGYMYSYYKADNNYVRLCATF